MDIRWRSIISSVVCGLALGLLIVIGPALADQTDNNTDAKNSYLGSKPSESMAPRADGFITGVVTARDTLLPISNVSVCAYQSSPYIYQCGLTGINGVYSITLPPGSDYRIEYVAYGTQYIPEYYNDMPYDNSAGYTPVAVLDGLVTSDINADLTPGVQIIGQVTDEGTSNPLPNIFINVSGNAYYASATTDANGVYTTAPGLPPGSYQVNFSDSSRVYASEYYTNAYRPSLATLLAVTTTAQTGIDAALAVGAVITGTVTDPGPVNNIYIYVYYGDEYVFATNLTTNLNGTYRLAGLGPVGYKLWFYDVTGVHITEWYDHKPAWDLADPITPTSGATTTVDFQMTLGGVLSGTVVAEESGLPLSNVSVSAYTSATNSYVNGATTNASGIYRIGGLLAGDYKLRFYDNTGNYLTEYYDNQPNPASADPINVASGLTTTINVSLTTGGVISGTIFDANTGALLSDIAVTVYDAAIGNSVGNTTSDASGVYRLSSLLTKNYKLRFYDNAGNYLTEYYDNQPDLTSADLISVTAGTTVTLNISMTTSGVLSGTIIDESDGTPLTGINVTLYNSVTGGYVSGAATDASGLYRMGGLLTGNYKVHFSDGAGNYLPEYYNNQSDFSTADPVSLTTGLTVTLNLSLTKASAISGTLTDEDSGLSINNINITAYDATSGNYVNSASTDASGLYRISSLRAGNYKLQFYDYAGNYLAEYYDNRPDSGTADVITLTTGVTATANASLTSGGSITGFVTDAGSGLPINNISVTAYDAVTGNYLNGVSTNASGLYRIGSLPTGSYKLQLYDNTGNYLAEYYSHQPDFASADALTVTAGLTATANLSLTLSGIISGTVTDADSGLPLNNINVTAYNAATGNSISSANSNASGVYRLGSLPTGSYKLRFRDNIGNYLTEYYDNQPDLASANAFSVTGGLTVTLNVSMTTGGALSGTISDQNSGLPLNNVNVIVYNAATGNSISSVNSNVSGVYRLSSLPTGSYKLRFRDNSGNYLIEYYDNKLDLTSADAISVTSGLTTTINVSLTTGGVISGTIFDANTGALLSDIAVTVYDAAIGNSVGNTTSDASGVYRLSGLLTKNYKLRFYDNAGNYLAEYYDNQPDLTSANLISVTAGTTVTLNISMTTSGVLSGMVTDESDGTPLTGINVTLYNSVTGGYVSGAATDASGLYRMGGLLTGNYKVHFSDGAGNYLPEYYNNQSDFSTADPVSLTTGLTVTLNLSLTKASAISGTLTDEDSGLPINNINVTAYDATSGNYANSTSTDASGLYRLGGLQAGNYKLQFYDYAGNYLAEYYDNHPDSATADVITLTTGITATANASLTSGGSITGFVTDAGSGLPINNISVAAYEAVTGNYLNGVSTNASGLYRIGSLPTGSYKLQFYDNTGNYLAEYYFHQPNFNSADALTVTAGLTATANLSLTLSGIISGTVTDADSGLPLNSVNVTAYNAATGNSISSANSNASGVYRLGSLPTGSYKLRFRDNNGNYLTEYYDNQPDLASANAFSVTAGLTVTLNVSMTTGGVFSGTISDQNSGRPLNNVNVIVYNAATGNSISSVNSNVSGVYRLSSLPTGSYKLRFRDNSGNYLTEYYDNKLDLTSADAISVTSGLTTTINVSMTVGGVISGMVTDESNGAPLNDINVNVYNAATGSYVNGATTNASGLYRVAGLLTGNYKLQFYDGAGNYLSEYYNNQPNLTSANLVSVTAGLTATANSSLTAGGVISGVVTDENTGAPLSGININALDAATGGYVNSASTDALGLYRLSGLQSKNYKLSFNDNAGNYALEYYNNQPDFARANTVNVTLGVTATANAALTRGGSITGFVTDVSSGLPINNINVTAYEAVTGNYLNGVSTNASGLYRIGSLPTGNYKLQFYDYAGNYLAEYYSHQPDFASANALTVTAGLTITANLSLTSGGVISGLITSEANGTPLNNVNVTAYNAATGNYVNSTTSNASGYYRVGSLLTGSYKLLFRDNTGNYLAEYYNNRLDLVSAEAFSVTMGVTTTLNISLTGAGVISGMVTDENSGAVLNNINVTAYNATTGNSLSSANSNASGFYRLGNLPTGSYKLRFQDNAGNYFAEFYNNQPSLASANQVSVTVGVTTTLNVSLTLGGAISGTLTDENAGLPLSSTLADENFGVPLSGITVNVYDATTGNYVKGVTSDALGMFHAGGLTTGNYKLQFYDSAGRYVLEYYNHRPDLASADSISVTVGATTALNVVPLKAVKTLYLPLIVRSSP